MIIRLANLTWYVAIFSNICWKNRSSNKESNELRINYSEVTYKMLRLTWMGNYHWMSSERFDDEFIIFPLKKLAMKCRDSVIPKWNRKKE